MRTAERRMRRPVADEIRRAMMALAAAEQSPGRAFEVMDGHRANMERILREEYRRLFDDVGGRIIRLGPKAHPTLIRETKFADRFEQVAREWISTMGANKVTPIINTTQKQAVRIIRAATQAGWDAGEGQRQVGERIMRAMTEEAGVLSRWRANVIARTETHTAAQAAGYEAEASLGLDLRKQWVASFDERTRESHAQANGQTVGHSDFYDVGGSPALYPGDMSLPPEEVINCRCVSVAVVEE